MDAVACPAEVLEQGQPERSHSRAHGYTVLDVGGQHREVRLREVQLGRQNGKQLIEPAFLLAYGTQP